jgi:uncharacterized membrane protein
MHPGVPSGCKWFPLGLLLCLPIASVTHALMCSMLHAHAGLYVVAAGISSFPTFTILGILLSCVLNLSVATADH